MDIKELLLSAGSTALNTFAPGAGTMVHGLVNKYVLDEELPEVDELTGDDAASIISTKLTGDQQSVVFGRKVDLEIQKSIERINESNNERIMRELEHKEVVGGYSPRPNAVNQMVNLLRLQIYFLLGFISILLVTNGILVYKGKEIIDVASMLPDFTILGTIMGTPAIVIMKYFGDRTKDKQVASLLASGADSSKMLTLTQAIGQRILK